MKWFKEYEHKYLHPKYLSRCYLELCVKFLELGVYILCNRVCRGLKNSCMHLPKYISKNYALCNWPCLLPL